MENNMGIYMKWINLFAFLIMIVVNALANFLEFGGHTTGAVSEKYPTLFTPAPYTFSIWGVIYLMMGFFVIYQLGFTRNTALVSRLLDDVNIWFFLSCIFNIAWLFAWHYDKIGLSLIAIVCLFFCIMVINIRMIISIHATLPEKIVVVGFNIYLGWLTAAIIANLSVFLVRYNWNRFGLSDEFWTMLVLIAGTVVGIAYVTFGRRYFSTYAIIWAYIGILVKHISSEANGHGREYPMIINTLIILIAIMICSTIIALPAQLLTRKTPDRNTF